MKFLNGVLIVLAAATGGFFIGRVVQKRLEQPVIIELYEETGLPAPDSTQSLGYLKFSGPTVTIVQDITETTPATLEAALGLRSILKKQLPPNQKISFLSLEDAALLSIVQQPQQA